MSFLARCLSNLIGIVVPIVQSFKILKKPTNKPLIQSVQYWSVYGSFLVIDWLLTTFFVSCFIPFYDFFVLIFTILLAVPQIGFAAVLYTKFLAPFLRKYERRIDKFTSKCVEKVWEKIPGLALTVPAILTSILSALSEPSTENHVVRIENITEIEKTPRSARKPQAAARSFEVQSEDDTDDVAVFREFRQREIKQEIVDDEQENEEIDEIREIVRPIMTRRRTRAQSVM